MQGDERFGVRETVEGVEVAKRYDDEEFPFPSIVYEIASEREEPVTLRIEDAVPPGVEVGNVGFHRAFGGEHWSIDGDRLVYEAPLDPSDETKTVYALSAPGTVDPDALFAEPEVISVDPPIETDTSEDEAGDWVPNEPEATGEAPDGGQRSESISKPADGDGAVAALAQDLKADRYDESDLATIVAAIADADDAPSGHLESRIGQLEEDVSRLRAYTGDLETLLDGCEATTLTALPERVDALESDIETVHTETEEERARLEDDLDSLAETVETIDDTIGSLRAELEADLDSLAATVETLEADLERLHADVDELSAELPETDLEDAQADLEARLEEVESFLEEIRSALG